MGLFNHFCAKKKETIKKEYINEIQELIENNFNVMFIPVFDIFENQEQFQLKYPYTPDYRYTCKNCHYQYDSFQTKYYFDCMEEKQCVIIEIKDLGSFVFTNHLRDALFLVLQRYFKDVTSYVFKGNETGAYFKILKNGKIVRKIASYLVMEGIVNYPETRGIPCEYEIAKGKTWKIDPKAQLLKEMLKDFNKEDVLNLFDYYIGLDNFKTENIERILIYQLII